MTYNNTPTPVTGYIKYIPTMVYYGPNDNQHTSPTLTTDDVSNWFIKYETAP